MGEAVKLKRERIVWLDWAKVFGIYLVVLGHAYYVGEENHFRDFIYSFHMPFFFLLSGILHRHRASFKETLKREFRSLIVPYVLLNLLVTVIFVLPVELWKGFEWSIMLDYLWEFLIAGCCSPARATWFLLALFYVKIFAHFILPLRWGWVLALNLLGIAIVLYLGFVVHWEIPTGVDRALLALPFYTASYYLAKSGWLDKVLAWKWTFVLFLVSFATLAYIVSFQGAGDISARTWGVHLWLHYPSSFLGCFMMLLFSKLFDAIRYRWVEIMATGTLIILAVNDYFWKIGYRLAYLIDPDHDMSFWRNIIIAIFILLALYYPIIWVQKFCPILTGGRSFKKS